jgi:putative restriction endonuclease
MTTGRFSGLSKGPEVQRALRSSACGRERLDGSNGLLLAPHIDHLFDKGFISFADDGLLLISPVGDHVALRQMGVPVDEPFQTGGFTAAQQVYLMHHRAECFKKSMSGGE